MYKNQIFSGEELNKNLGMDVPSGSRDHFQITPEDDQFDMAFMAGEGEGEIPGGLYSNYWQDGSNLVGDHLQLVSSETMMMQEGFSLSSPKLKAKRRKAAVAERMEVYGGHVVRSSGGRRDRHSKVCTARGTTRDRRVRLSPKTAIQFYDVQDRLGYDRPSKAIDWLMKEAKAAIDALDESQTPPPPPQPAGNLDTNTPESIFFSNYELHRYEEDSNSILDQGGFLPPSIPPDLFDPNSELLRLQRIFNFPGCSYEREPLQSSITNISPIIPQFSSFRLPNEQIPNLAAATMAEAEIDNNMDKILHHIS